MGEYFYVFLFFSLAVAFVPWGVIPFPSVYSDLNLGILFVLAASSISVYSVMVSGWVSNSKTEGESTIDWGNEFQSLITLLL